MKLETAVLAGFTALAAGQDLRKKQVDINLYWIFGMIAGAILVFRMWENQNIMWEKAAEGLFGFLPGLVLLGLGKVSRGSIGAGDGCYFLISGLLLGFWRNLAVLFYGTLCCGLFCLVYFVWGNFKKKDNLRKQTVPFLPFAAVPVFWMIIGEAAGGWKG